MTAPWSDCCLSLSPKPIGLIKAERTLSSSDQVARIRFGRNKQTPPWDDRVIIYMRGLFW